MTPPEIHVLCYNNVDFTLRTLERLKAWCPAHPIRLIDNGSEKKYVERLKTWWDEHATDADLAWWFDPAEMPREAHVARAKNHSIKVAKTDWILLLDNDAYPLASWWKEMVLYIDTFPEVALWSLYKPSNHRIVHNEATTKGPLLTKRTASLLSGVALLLDRVKTLQAGIWWPDKPVDYTGHPHHADMGPTFHDTDVEFGLRFERAGLDVALPHKDLARHCWQPGRETGYR